MDVNLLDRDQDGRWILGKVTLWEYLSNLSEDSFNYEIQRGIVTNPYLDTILDSIVEKTALPPFSLVTSRFEIDANGDGATLDDINILDGLQRTYRLWLYKKISETAIRSNIENYRDVTSMLKERFPNMLRVISPRQIRSLFECENRINVWNLQQCYENCFIYLYVWQGLSQTEVVKKMLILNAGQKRMSISHQYELMYMQVFNNYAENIAGVTLFRSKDARYEEVKKGKRLVGEYPIPSIIIGLQSFIAGKPIRLSSDMLLNAMPAENEFISVQATQLFFNSDFIRRFTEAMLRLDHRLCDNNNEAIAWFVKDTTISGMMAGMGEVIREQFKSDDDFAQNSTTRLIDFSNNLVGDDPFQLEMFYAEYNKLASARINIGIILRRAIAFYTKGMIEAKKTTWASAFRLATNKGQDCTEWID